MNKKSICLLGVEIGVHKGDNAYFILKNLSIKKLFLIDPYLEYSGFKGNNGWAKVSQSDFNKNLIEAEKKIKHFKDKVTIIREKSIDAIKYIPNDLDFVYIDGNHDYEYVKHDIKLYYPKLKCGGIIGGDNFESVFPGVAHAVIEFANKHNLKIHGARSEASYEWWIIKK